jgi:hypothetical protein
MTAPRAIGVRCLPAGEPAATRGLLAPDPRVRTLCRVLISYPEIRHITPDRVSFDATADARTLETVARFLERQQWLVAAVTVQ